MPFKIYYIDDEQSLCENFEDYFSTKEIVVTTFVDANVAIEVINREPPDLLFIDYRLPGTTGDEVAKVLDPKIIKFLITGEISIKTEYKFKKKIDKPYDERVISELISNYIVSKNVG